MTRQIARSAQIAALAATAVLIVVVCSTTVASREIALFVQVIESSCAGFLIFSRSIASS